VGFGKIGHGFARIGTDKTLETRKSTSKFIKGRKEGKKGI
jgi:hypothetical protein